MLSCRVCKEIGVIPLPLVLFSQCNIHFRDIENQSLLLCDIYGNISYVFSQFYPLFGPKQGGTLLTIDGINLGKSYEDIVSNISIAGVQCAHLYARSMWNPNSECNVYHV